VSVSEDKTGQNPNNDPNNDRDDARRRIGLCADCRFMRLIESARGSRFYLCERSATDPTFPKYPRLPVLQCRGYESTVDKGTPSTG
jgi:hypothetical protein